MLKGALVKTVPVAGSVVLFLSWAYQQSLLRDTNDELQRIKTAWGVYQTYQSNNALFNAVIETVEADSPSAGRIRRLQIYNYELGLRDMEALLDPEDLSDIPKPPDPYSGGDTSAMMETTQARLTEIQGKLQDKRDAIARRQSRRNAAFLAIYAAGSVTLLVGSGLNVVATAREGQKHTGTDRPASFM